MATVHSNQQSAHRSTQRTTPDANGGSRPSSADRVAYHYTKYVTPLSARQPAVDYTFSSPRYPPTLYSKYWKIELIPSPEPRMDPTPQRVYHRTLTIDARLVLARALAGKASVAIGTKVERVRWRTPRRAVASYYQEEGLEAVGVLADQFNDLETENEDSRRDEDSEEDGEGQSDWEDGEDGEDVERRDSAHTGSAKSAKGGH